MSKVRRPLIAGGTTDHLYTISCAVLQDGTTSPAWNALESLRQGTLEGDLDRKRGDPWPDEEQPTDFYKFVADAKILAERGVPRHRLAINALDDGVWEFKNGKKRLSFFDTDGQGGYSPKFRYENVDEAEYPDEEFWWFPLFEPEIRLGHFFIKEGQKAGKENTDMCCQVRREDLSHDEGSSATVTPIKSIEA